MKRSRILTALALVLILVMSLMMTGCSGNDKKADPIPNDTVVLTIEGRDITMEEYRYYYLGLKAQFDYGNDSYWKDNAEDREQLKSLALDYLKQGAAFDKLLADNKYEANADDKAWVEKDIQSLKDMYDTDAEYQELLEDNYLTEEVYRRVMLRNKILYRYLYDYNKANKADKMAKYLEDYVRAKHILVQFSESTSSTTSSDGSTRTKAEAMEIVKEIQKKLADGADFDALIKEYGEDPGMESNPDGYCFTYDEMVEEFETAAFALEIGGISEPVETPYGYHIILRLDIDDAYQEEYFSSVFVDDEFYEDMEAEAEQLMDQVNVTYTEAYDKIDIETVA